MRKWIALILAAVTLALCGCTAPQGPEQTTAPQVQQTTAPTQETLPPETADPKMDLVDLTVWVTAENIWADEETLNALLEEFNAYYPNIIIHVEHVDGVQTEGALPDMILGDAKDLNLWRETVPMADLSNLWQSLSGDVYDAVAKACGDANGYFSIPLCAVPYCMAINRQKFEAAKAVSLINTANHTWSTVNFLKAGVNLYDSGLENAMTIYCMDTQGDVYSRLLVENMYGGTYVNTINGEYNADSDAMTRGVEELRTGLGFKYLSDVSADMAMEQFLNGETAMIMNWSSALQLEHLEQENIFYMNYPSTGKTKTYTEVYGLSVVAAEDSTQLAASMTFASYVAMSDAAVRATGQLPARKSASDAYDGTDLEETMDDLSKLLESMVEGEIPGKCWEDARQEWLAMLQEISRGTNVGYCTRVCQRNLEQILVQAERGY